jgi:light-regulated signal transduction histidine kinase (bacteriophytochrome)
MIRVLVVEDSPTVREFLLQILGSDPAIEVVATAETGEEALEAVERFRPDIITMDIHMPRMNGFDATRRIMETHPTPIVIVSGAADATDTAKAFRAIESGALAVLSKPAGVAERTAQLAAANDELEAFSYSVSHDLRAPLRHINGFAGTLIEEHSSQLQPQAQHQLKRIQEGTQKMARMIDDLLNLARLDRRSMTLQMTPLNSLVENVLHDLESETTDRKIDWRVGSLPSVNCDPGLIRQVFVNLLSNAVKYTRRCERAVIEIDQSTVEGQLVLFVRDNGAGFNSKYSDKLFGTFQRLHSDEEFEGTGVGLATVQRIIRKHGGRVWAEAEINKGATFYFSLGESASMSGAVNRQASGK